MPQFLLAVAILALSLGSSSAAQPQCNRNKEPGQPWNTLLTQNSFQAGQPKAKLTMTWRSPVKGPEDGCLDGYRIESYANGRLQKSDRLMADPMASPMSHTIDANPGETVTLKIVAFNTGNGKESSAAEVATVKAAGTPPGKPVPL